ncbi:MAG: twin-arginine translocase TatA/TatE family subunit [Myxococcales bacterium]|nr:twin-arginine translocase TatA/TatE family subunit [Myxococcales bacterium]
MFGLGFQEILVIAVVALIVVGPKRLPQVGQALGRALAEFRRASDEFRRGLEDDESLRTVRKTGEEIRNAGRDLKAKIAVPAEAIAKPKPRPPIVDVAVTEMDVASGAASAAEPDDAEALAEAPAPKA